jgi:hypothetical protein
VEGKVARGFVPSAGSGTFSGLCSTDMGDGRRPLTAVPFVVAAVGGSGGRGTLGLTLGVTSLPTATINTGSLTLK